MRHATWSPPLEAVSGWVYERGVAHAAHKRGPVLYETYCGRSVPGPLEPSTPTRICGHCRRVIESGVLERDRTPAVTETQGRLF